MASDARCPDHSRGFVRQIAGFVLAACVHREFRMRVKIYGGTPIQNSESLCDTCRASHIVRGRRADEELVFCEVVPMHSVRITFKVTECSNYIDDREPSYAELAEKAWILTPASHRRPAGFVRASDLREEERFRYLADPTQE